MNIISALNTDALFQCSESDMLEAEREYTLYEVYLLDKMGSIKRDFPGYFSYDASQIEPIGHDPYDLVAILSAIKPDWHIDDPETRQIMHQLKQPRRQYTIVTRARDPKTDEVYSLDEAEARKDELELVARLTNYDLECTVDSLLTEDQLAAYAGYLHSRTANLSQFALFETVCDLHEEQLGFERQTKRYTAKPETLESYPRLKQMTEIAAPYIGYPYVWGCSSPKTSFDCSGFIDYILGRMGYDFYNMIDGKKVRLPVAGSYKSGRFYDGIYEKCQPVNEADKQPGDLVFFGDTFDVSYRRNRLTHVGIYCGDDIFLNCTDRYGVSYLSYDDLHASGHGVGPAWRELLAGYGRLPDLIGDNNAN